MFFFEFFKDILAPKKCYSCRKEGSFLCEKCFLKLSNFESICYVCKKYSRDFGVHKECKTVLRAIYFDNLLILTHYNNRYIKKLIKDSKFYSRKDILEDFGLYLSVLFENHFYGEDKNDFIISFVPMYFSRKLIRGYNQSEILARCISKNLLINLEKNLIKRVKSTKQQSKLNREQRQYNLNNVFEINKKDINKVCKKKIILIDDVVSTGSTINEISKIFKKNGAKKIIGLVLASD